MLLFLIRMDPGSMYQGSGFRINICGGLAGASMFKRAVYMIGGLFHDLVSMRSKGSNGPIDDGQEP